ncbi:hypothetical protein [Parafrankia sp. EUN1f]|uniref:hypothetical protein n=1 Tax=Parafrankia sp. EUN1f TaxID=102897 RepID=UPI0001C452AC|nr:hypothetical protein [Parafrankia sp. EUN1f]EFC79079.1 hypothetical protein FrEUN1fDRAFT_7804 [Parafrankia sp. EUN1f]
MGVPARRVQLRLGTTWTEVLDDVLVRNPITIRHGQADEAPRADNAAASFSLNNRLGQYSPRNPYSPYYGLLGRNTPVRIGVQAGPVHWALDNPGDRLTTPAAAALNIAGDLDIRVDAASDGVSRDQWMNLVNRWGRLADQRSWRLSCSFDGLLIMDWSTDGTAGTIRTATSRVPCWNLFRDRRTVVRVTLDVDNGGGGRTINFMVGSSLTGPWTIIDTVVQAGTTSIYAAGSTPLGLGVPADYGESGPCRVYGAQVRNGIGGTVVANPDLTAQTPGATSFTDSAGRAWTLAGGEITDYRIRFAGEVAAWPASWDVSGRDVTVAVQAAGIRRRLGQGASPLQSTLRRRVMGGATLPRAYWPCEDGSDATYAASPLPGCGPLVTSGWTFAAGQGPAGSAELPTIETPSSAVGLVPGYRSTGEWRVEMVIRCDEVPAGGYLPLMEIHTTGTVARHRISLANPPAQFTLEGYSPTGTLIYGPITYAMGTATPTAWGRIILMGRQSGGNVEISALWTTIGGGSGFFPISPYAGAVGVVTSWQSTPDDGYQGLQVGHVSVWDDADIDQYASADHGYRGETPAQRIYRVAGEESAPASIAGGADSPGAMGPQPIATFLDVVGEAADLDGGLLHDRRHTLGLRLRGRRATYNQDAALVLDYAAGDVMPYLEPVDDDQATVNDVTITRTSGSSARRVLETGTLSVQAPPDGVGRYDTSLTLNLQTDGQAEQHAGWRLGLGTVDEARYPTVRISLLASPHLVDEVLDLDLMDRALLVNPPPWIPPDDIDLLVRGYTETINVDQWDLELNCAPGSPWQVGEWGDPDSRADTSGSTLAQDATASTTQLVVATTLDPVYDHRPWVPSAGPDAQPGQHPLDLRVGAEVVRATAVDDYARDAFARTSASGWGTADVGGAWQEVNGLATDRTVGSGLGRITLTSPSDLQRQQTILGDLADGELTVRFAVGQTSTGGAVLPAALLRYTGVNDFYRARVHAETDGTLSLSATRTTTQIGSTVATGLTYSPGTLFGLRVRLIGHRILARCWLAAGDEPGWWQLDETVTTSTIDTGRVGLVASCFATNTNSNPTVSFDDFRVISVQRMTVTRAINTVTRAWPAGTPVRLAYPTRIAL